MDNVMIVLFVTGLLFGCAYAVKWALKTIIRHVSEEIDTRRRGCTWIDEYGSNAKFAKTIFNSFATLLIAGCALVSFAVKLIHLF